MSQTILITTPSLAFHDAVSNDVWQLEKALTARGYQVFTYAEFAPDDPGVNLLSFNQARMLTQAQDVVWVYQHSIYWHRIEPLLAQAKCRVVMRYHNITPVEFFSKYKEKIPTYATQQGMTQTERFIKARYFERYINASKFNSGELVQMGADSARMYDVAPMNKIDDFKLAQLSANVKDQINKENTNILFVGRFAPNKGFQHLLRTLDRYIDMYGDKVCLHLAGNFGMAAPLYLKEIKDIVRERRLGKHIKVWGSVDLNELYTLYKTCDVLLVMSEHEGFCVPLIEAQFNEIPVVALDRAAVKETLGADQLCFKDLNYDKFATAVHVVAKDSEVKKYLVESGLKNQAQYENRVLEEKFCEYLFA